MPKVLSIALVLLMLAGCTSYKYSPQFAPKGVISNVMEHVVAITVTYPNPYYNPDYGYYRDPYIMYIGSGVVIEGNRILTVAHLFDHGELVRINTIRPIDPEAIECKLLVMTERDDNRPCDPNDYALIEPVKDLGLSGLNVADIDILIGEKTIYAGTVGGVSTIRFGFCTTSQYYFMKDKDGILKYVSYGDDPFITVYPGGPGDSGGTITNIKGEIVGVMYCGIENHAESYVFSNKLSMLKEFLKKHEL